MSFGSAINSAFGAITGLGSQGVASAPQYQAATEDQATKDLIQSQQNRAQQSPDQFAAEQTRGVGQASSMLNPEATQRQNTALGGATPEALQTAINNRAMRAFQSGQANIQANAKNQAPLLQQQAVMTAANDLMKQQQIFNENIVAQNQAKRQQTMARNQIISGLFSGFGAIGGAAFMGNKKPPGQGGQPGSGGGGYVGSDTTNVGNIA